MQSIPILIGIVGGLCALVAYALVTLGRLSQNSIWYPILNLTAACSILVSLLVQWNFPAFLLNAVSVVIGVVALRRVLRLRRNA